MTTQLFLPGLAPFNTAQAQHFPGSQALAQDIFSTWRHQGEHGRTFLAVVGEPDSGKSSLLRAGVLPLLAADEHLATALWRHAIWYPSDHLEAPWQGLAAALLCALPELKKHHLHTEQLADLLTDHGTAAELLLKTTLDMLAQAPAEPEDTAPAARLVLLIENLEQVLLPHFTQAQRDMLGERLAQLASSGRCWILASVDKAALEPLKACAGFAQLLSGSGQYRLPVPQAEQWHTMLQASLSKPAQDAGLHTQLFNALQQPSQPLIALQAEFMLIQQGQDKARIGELSDALTRYISLVMPIKSTAEREAIQSVLRVFAIDAHEKGFYTGRKPLSHFSDEGMQRECLDRLLEHHVFWQEAQEPTQWIGVQAPVLHTLHYLSQQAVVLVPSAPSAPPPALEELDDKAAFKRYFPWQPAVLMGLLVCVLAMAVVFLPYYQDTVQAYFDTFKQKWWVSESHSPAANNTDRVSATPTPAPVTMPVLPQIVPHPLLDDAEFAPLQPVPVMAADTEEKPAPRPKAALTPAKLDQLAAEQKAEKQWANALALHQQGLKLRLEVYREAPPSEDILQQLSRNYDQIGRLQERLKHREPALKSYQNALNMSQQLFKLAPDKASSQRDLALSYQRIGDLHQDKREYAPAAKHYQTALIYFKQAADTEKSRPPQRALAVAYDKLGDVQALQQDTSAALSSYQSALSVRQALLQRYRDLQSQQNILLSHAKINSLWQQKR